MDNFYDSAKRMHNSSQILHNNNEFHNSCYLAGYVVECYAKIIVGLSYGFTQEELAKELGAATACSRPVADMHWRPHHEHVGQTGVAIRPNLYIAIGISGAIQHLAGVNGSKTIVVINSDKEAPFFKSADYGILGDAFTIVPKLVEAVKKFKANQN